MERRDQVVKFTKSNEINGLKFIPSCSQIVLGASHDFQKRANDVVNISKPIWFRPIADLNRQTAADIMTERRHNRVIVWPAPLPKHIWKPVNIHWRAVFAVVFQHRVFRRLLTPPIGVVPLRLYRGAEHQRYPTTGRRQTLTQLARKIGIALHEFFFVFWPINAGEVKHKVGPGSQF